MQRTRHTHKIYSSNFDIQQIYNAHISTKHNACNIICWWLSGKCKAYLADNQTENRNIYIYKDMTLSTIDMDFHISSTWAWLHHFSQVFFNVWKKRVFKIFKSWQVCGWLTKWFIMLGFKDLRQPRGYWRSNVGLVLIMLNYDIET